MKFCLVDRIESIEPGKRIVCIKALSLAEEYLAKLELLGVSMAPVYAYWCVDWFGGGGLLAAAGAVLLAEDDRAVRELTAMMLASLGFGVIQAKDGVEAVEMFGQRQAEICCVVCWPGVLMK